MMNYLKQKFTISAIFIIYIITHSPYSTHAQLIVNTNTPSYLVQNVLVGTGVSVSNISFTGSALSLGEFSNGNSTNLGLNNGLVMSNGLITDIPNNATFLSSTFMGSAGDPDLDALGFSTFDATVLEFDFVPTGDTIRFKYIFASEEYPDFVFSGFNDVFAFFITGPNPLGGNYTNKNIAIVPGTALPVTIDNINSTTNSQYFVDNGVGIYIVFNGFTTVLTAMCPVTPCQQYHLKLAIGDVIDEYFDSAVFLEANSFSTNSIFVNTFPSAPQAGNDAIEGCNNITVSFNLPQNTPIPININYTITGSATNGTDYPQVPSFVTIPAGQDSAFITFSPSLDGLPEGTETINIIYQISTCGDFDTVSFNIKDNTPMNITTSNDTSICSGQASIWAQVSGGTPPYSYSWNNGAGSNSSALVSPGSTTTYTITVSDLCGTTITDNVTVSISSGSAEAGQDVTICEGEQTTLIASGGTSYQWSNGINTANNTVSPTTSTMYYVTAQGVCDPLDSVTVFVNPAPILTVISDAPGNTISLGDDVTITVNGASTYNWTSIPPDPTLTGQETYASITVYPTVNTTYYVTGDDGSGCMGTQSILIIVIPDYPNIDFSATPTEGCMPFLVQFIDNSTKVAYGASYYWDFGNGITSTQENPEVLYDQIGTFDVTLVISNPGGYTSSATYPQYIKVNPIPIALLDVSPDRLSYKHEADYFFFDKSMGNPVKWHWEFGDYDTTNTQNTQHTYSDTGTYNLMLAVANEFGCWDTTYEIIQVNPDWGIYVPNSFTPNNDGTNDYFWVQGNGIVTFEIIIFNRWGQLLFSSSNLETPWDGSFNDYPSPTGVYVYIVRYRDALLNEHILKGHITLFR